MYCGSSVWHRRTSFMHKRRPSRLLYFAHFKQGLHIWITSLHHLTFGVISWQWSVAYILYIMWLNVICFIIRIIFQYVSLLTLHYPLVTPPMTSNTAQLEQYVMDLLPNLNIHFKNNMFPNATVLYCVGLGVEGGSLVCNGYNGLVCSSSPSVIYGNYTSNLFISDRYSRKSINVQITEE